MCPPALRGGINLRNGVEQIASQRGPPRPSPPLVVAGSGLTFPPWVGCGKWGPKGSLEPSTNLVAGQAAGPLEKPGDSQNCPQLYQGESGGLEPAMKPMAGQAGAPLHSLSP